jgi:5'-nucleotidase/5'-nucleotidase/UDP-sugar diphosphatase
MLSLAAAQDARFPLLSANLRPAPFAQTHAIRAWTVVEAGGLRVGVIGLTTQAEVKRLVPGEFEIGDPLAAALDLLPELRAQSDVVVALSHLGHSQADPYPPSRGIRDVELALALPHAAMPVIIGAHTHTLLNETELDPANMVNGILLAQAGGGGRYLGDIEIIVGPAGSEVVAARLWPVDALPDDKEFERGHVLPLAQPVREMLAEAVGVFAPDAAFEDGRAEFASRESALANFAADALASRCRAAGLSVDFFMLDAPGLSGDLPPAGPLTFGDLFRLAPYADSIILLRLPSDRLQAFLDDNARRADLPGQPREERGFVQFSREVRYRVVSEGGGDRAALRATCPTVAGLTPAECGAREFVVGCSSFFREFSLPWEQRAEQDGLPLFDVRGLPTEFTHLALREELVAFVRERGGITSGTGLARDGRVVFEGTARA